MRKTIARSLALGLAGLLLQPGWAFPKGQPDGGSTTATPIQHVVVIFQENVSFDHYFGSYPAATDFVAQPGTPTVNGLTSSLLINNPNKSNSANTCGY